MSIGWPDLGGALLWIVGTLLVVGGVVGLLIWDARRRRSLSVAIDVTAALARMWLVLVVVGAVVVVVKWFTVDFTEVAELPVSMPWPTNLPCASGTTDPTGAPTLECAGVGTVSATLTSLGLGTRLVLGAGGLFGLVLAALPGVLVIVICRAARAGSPFTRVTSRWLLIAAGVLLVAGISAAVLTDIGSAMAANEVLPAVGDGPVTATGIYRINVPLWPVGGAAALAALGAVFRHGVRLQRDSDLLV